MQASQKEELGAKLEPAQESGCAAPKKQPAEKVKPAAKPSCALPKKESATKKEPASRSRSAASKKVSSEKKAASKSSVRPVSSTSSSTEPSAANTAIGKIEMIHTNFIRSLYRFSLALDDLSETQRTFHYMIFAPYKDELKKYLFAERELLRDSYTNLQATDRYLSLSLPFRQHDLEFGHAFKRYRTALLRFHKAEWDYRRAQRAYQAANIEKYSKVPPALLQLVPPAPSTELVPASQPLQPLQPASDIPQEQQLAT